MGILLLPPNRKRVSLLHSSIPKVMGLHSMGLGTAQRAPVGQWLPGSPWPSLLETGFKFCCWGLARATAMPVPGH